MYYTPTLPDTDESVDSDSDGSGVVVNDSAAQALAAIVLYQLLNWSLVYGSI
jgi:hypothetical protein